MTPARYPDPIPGIIPFGTLTIFAGAPAVGKTTMLVDWIRRWFDGRSIWHHPSHRPTHVYYVCADRGQTEEQFRSKVGDNHHADITFYSVVSSKSGIDHTNFHKDAHGRELLTKTIVDLQPIPGSHLILDPLAPLFITGNQNRSRDVAASLIGLSRTIEERHINITGICHFSKQKADKNDRYRRPQDRISGSGAFSGFSDTQIYLVDPEPPKIDYYTLGWNPRNHPPEEFKCTRAEWFTPYIDLTDVGVDITEREHLVLNIIPEEGIAPAALQRRAEEDLGIAQATYWRYLRELTSRELVTRDDRGWIQKCPPRAPAGAVN